MVSLKSRSCARMLLTFALPVLGASVGLAQPPPIAIVNMIPNSLSDEAHGDTEPNIAVNPTNPLQIAGSAFTPDPSGGSQAPIYVSTDGGKTWTLNSIVPSDDSFTGTGDITIR